MTENTHAEVSDFPHGRVPREVRERQIRALALELFAERGYAGASMDELARRAGVSKPVIYDLAENKEALYVACVQDTARELSRRVAETVGAHAEPEAQLRAGALAFFEFVAEHRRAWDALLSGAPGPFAAQADAIREGQSGLVATLMTRSALALGAGITEEEADAFAHAVNGASEALARWWASHPGVEATTLAEWMVALVYPGLERILTERARGA